jgi:hypothetical protein
LSWIGARRGSSVATAAAAAGAGAAAAAASGKNSPSLGAADGDAGVAGVAGTGATPRLLSSSPSQGGWMMSRAARAPAPALRSPSLGGLSGGAFAGCVDVSMIEAPGAAPGAALSARPPIVPGSGGKQRVGAGPSPLSPLSPLPSSLPSPPSPPLSSSVSSEASVGVGAGGAASAAAPAPTAQPPPAPTLFQVNRDRRAGGFQLESGYAVGGRAPSARRSSLNWRGLLERGPGALDAAEPADAPFDALASAGAAVERIAKALIDEVIARDTNDNMTVVLLAFPDAFHPFFGERLLRDRADKDRAAAEAAAADAAATDEAERDL